MSNRIRTAYINNINALKKAGCSELGAKMAADMLLDKEAIVEENQKLKSENEELKAQLDDDWINENKVAELAYVLHRIKIYSETADVSERKIDKVISDIISFDWKKGLMLKKEVSE